MKKILMFTLLSVLMSLSAEVFTLEKCIETGLKNNLSLKQTDLDLENSELGVESAKNNFFSVSASASDKLSHSDSDIDDINDYNTSQNRIEGSLSASATLSKALLEYYDKALINKEYYSVKKDDDRRNLIHEITRAYLNTIITQEDLKVKDEKTKLSKMNWDEAKLKYDIGNITKSDLLTSEVALSSDSLEVIKAKYDIKTYKQSLINLLNIDIMPDEMELSYDFTAEIDDSYTLEDLLKQTEEQHPELVMVDKSLEMSKLMLSAEESTYLPSLGANMSVGGSRTDKFGDTWEGYIAGAESTTDNINYSAGLSVTWDLTYSDFNEIDKQRVSLRKAEISLKQKESSLKNQVKVAYFDYLAAKEDLRRIDKHIELAKQNLDLANEMFRLGNKTITDQIKAKNDYISALYSKNRSIYNYKLAVVELLKATGN